MSESTTSIPDAMDILLVTRAMRARMLHCELKWEMSAKLSLLWIKNAGCLRGTSAPLTRIFPFSLNLSAVFQPVKDYIVGSY